MWTTLTNRQNSYFSAMRMEKFLADIEAKALAGEEKRRRVRVAQSVRKQRAQTVLCARLAAHIGTRVGVGMAGQHVTGVLVECTDEWLALNRRDGAQALVDLSELTRPGVVVTPLSAVESVTGLSLQAVAQVPDDAPTFLDVARTWSIARTRVRWRCRNQQTYTGTIAAVGADHVLIQQSPRTVVALPSADVVSVEPVFGA